MIKREGVTKEEEVKLMREIEILKRLVTLE